MPVGPRNGLGADRVVSYENIFTVPSTVLDARVGTLLETQEQALTVAIKSAFYLL